MKYTKKEISGCDTYYNWQVTSKFIPTYIEKEKSLLTSDEVCMYSALIKMCSIEENKEKYRDISVLAQVALNQIIDRNKDKGHYTYMNYCDKSIDFVLFNRETNKIYCCIELNGSFHNSRKEIKRDIFISKIFKDIKIPLIFIKSKYENNKAKPYYSPKEIDKKIDEKINEFGISRAINNITDKDNKKILETIQNICEFEKEIDDKITYTLKNKSKINVECFISIKDNKITVIQKENKEDKGTEFTVEDFFEEYKSIENYEIKENNTNKENENINKEQNNTNEEQNNK